MKTALMACMALVLLSAVACTRSKNVSYKDNVQKALEQADLKDVTVSEDRDKNTITLGGKLHSDDAKQRAAEIAQSAADGSVIANEISVEPVGKESDARNIESNVDDLGFSRENGAAFIGVAAHRDYVIEGDVF